MSTWGQTGSPRFLLLYKSDAPALIRTQFWQNEKGKEVPSVRIQLQAGLPTVAWTSDFRGAGTGAGEKAAVQEQGLRVSQAGAVKRLSQPTAAAALWSRGRCEAQAQTLCKSSTTTRPEGDTRGWVPSKWARKACGLPYTVSAKGLEDLIPLTFRGSSQRRLSLEMKPCQEDISKQL